MKPQELYRALNVIRREQGIGWTDMAVLVGVDEADLHAMRRGVVSGGVRARVTAFMAEVA